MFIVQITETPPYDVLLLDNILFYVPFENVSHWKLCVPNKKIKLNDVSSIGFSCSNVITSYLG